MSPPPNKIQQRSQGQDNKGVMLEKHMCCMNHPVGYAVFISVTLWYPPFSSHGEHVLCPVHFQVKSGSDHTEHQLGVSLKQDWALSVKQLPEIHNTQVRQYVPFGTDFWEFYFMVTNLYIYWWPDDFFPSCWWGARWLCVSNLSDFCGEGCMKSKLIAG